MDNTKLIIIIGSNHNNVLRQQIKNIFSSMLSFTQVKYYGKNSPKCISEHLHFAKKKSNQIMLRQSADYFAMGDDNRVSPGRENTYSVFWIPTTKSWALACPIIYLYMMTG